MSVPRNGTREVVRRVTLFATVVSAVMLLVSGWLFVRSPDAVGAATLNGGLTVSPGSGTGATDYTLTFPNGVGTACPGDSASDGYLLSGFIVPSSTSIDGLQFNALGPVGGGLSIQDAGGTVLLDQTVEVVTGNVIQLPGAFSFANNLPGDFPAGDYLVGLACTQGNGAGMVKAYWTTTMTISGNVDGGPAQIDWTVSTSPTTTSSTSTSSSSTTSTTTGGSTTTTAGGTTTTTAGGTTSTTDGASASGSGVFGGTPSAASPVTTAGQLPYTGSSPLPMVFWAVCLIVFGRMAMLLGRRTRVIGDDSP
jgi:hypothetical protein